MAGEDPIISGMAGRYANALFELALEGFFLLKSAKDAKAFIEACAALRFWARELTVDLDAAVAG